MIINNIGYNYRHDSDLYDGDGKMWLVYGSWSGGIFFFEVDEATGKGYLP